MNPDLRRREGPTTVGGRALSRWLPPLMVRIHALRIDALAERIEADTRSQVPEEEGDHGFAIALSVEGDALLARYAQVRTRRRELSRAHESVRTDAERRAVLLHHLRTSVEDAKVLREDIAALDRWMDLDALLERLDAEARRLFLDLELLARLLRHHALRGQPSVFLDRLVDSPHPPTRRAAVATLAEWVGSVLRTGKDRDGTLIETSAERIDRLMTLAMERGGDPLVARRALQLVGGMDEQNAARLLLERLEPPLRHERALRDDFLVRAAAIRLAVEIGPNTTRNAFMIARTDPSETVRCAMAEALSLSPSPNARTLLTRLQDEDPAASVRVRASRYLATARVQAVPVPAEGLADELAKMPVGTSKTISLPEGSTIDSLARLLLRRANRDEGFGLEETYSGNVKVHRGQTRVLRLWRVLHEARVGDPGKRQGGDHLSGRSIPGRVIVPPSRLADVSPTDVPGRPVVQESWESWCPWLPLPDVLVDGLWRGELRILSEQGWTFVRPPSGLRRIWAGLALSWRVKELSARRSESLRATDSAGLGGYAEALRELGFDVRFEPHHGGVDARVPKLFPGVEDWDSPTDSGVAPLIAVAVLDELNRFLALHPVEPVDLALVASIIGFIFFMRLGLGKLRTRNARESIPLVIGGWGTRGKSGVARLKAALFEGLGYDVVCKTTGCEAMLMRTPPLQGSVEVYLFRPFDRATIWEHAEMLERSAHLGAEVFVWECMALRPEYVEQLQLNWTRDDISTITNTYPDHEDVMGPTGDDVADTIARFMPASAVAITTETQMTPVLRRRADELDTRLIEVDEDGIAAVPEDLQARFPYQEHPANLALVAELCTQLDLDVEEALVLMADHVVPDLGVLATFAPLRHRGRILEFSNGSSANERTGFLNNWQRCGFDEHDAIEDAATFHVAVLNNRYDRVARSQVFAEIMVNDAAAHRYVCIGTNLEGLRGYINDALNARIKRLDVFGGGVVAVEGRLEAIERDLRIVDVPSLLIETMKRLDMEGSGTEEVCHQLHKLMEEVPPTPLDGDAARLLLGDISTRLREIGDEAGTIYHPNAHPDALFHDARDRDFGLAGAGDQWVELAVEALMFHAVRKACRAAAAEGGSAELSAAVGRTYRSIFLRHVILMPDSGSTGDAINERIAMTCPVGTLVRVMSCQNIKGTGLDLVYRWVYSRRPMEWVDQLDDRDPEVARRALTALREWKEWCVPLCHEVARKLEAMPQERLPALSSEVSRVVQAELKIRGKAMTEIAVAGEKGLFRSLLDELVDPFLGVIRRFRADRIFEDLAARRISHARAREELHRLTLTQRGEWIED